MVVRLIVAALAAYVLYAGLLFSLQRRVLYPGAGLSPLSSSPGASRPDTEALSLPTSGGGVDAWYVPAAGQRGPRSSPAAVVFHGNAEFAVDLVGWFAPLTDLGVAALYVEYPGFAGSAGKPSEASILEVAAAGYDWLIARPDVDPERVFAIGRSLGAGVAAGLTRERPLAALVLWSPFVSVGYMALRRYGLPPFLARDRYDTREALSVYPSPVLLFHGRQDPVIPYRHSTILTRVRGAELVTWECGHNDCPPTASEFWGPLSSFLMRNRILSSQD
jgi:dienelactone hydrolase